MDQQTSIVDEEGVPAGLGGDGPGPRPERRRGARPREQHRRQRAGVGRRQSVEWHAPHATGHERPQRAHERRVAAAAPHAEEQDGRSVGRPKHLPEEGEAVGVGPLQIVDDDHERAAVGDADEELAHGGEEPRAQLLRVHAGAVHPRRRGDGAHASQHREDVAEERRRPRQEGRRLLARQAPHVAAERVDDAVDRLEGHQLALVAAAAEHGHAALLEGVGEAAHDGALADPGLALDDERQRGARAAHLVEGRGQRVELLVAADEGRPEALVPRRRRGRPGGRAVEAREELAPGRPPLRVEPQELRAERVEVGRHAGAHGRRRRQIVVLLAHEHVQRRAGERDRAGERLVEQHADAVPVRLGPHALRGRLLRRHVVDGADGVPRGGLPAAREGGDEPEVEQHHAPRGRDQDVRRLDVPVRHARGVQGHERLTELRERRPQARLVPRRPRRRRGRVPQGARRRGAQGVLARRRAAVLERRRRRFAGQPRRRGARPHMLDEAHPLDELHGEEPAAGVLAQLAEVHEVRVLEILQRAELVLEAEQVLAPQVAHRLERDPAPPLLVERLVHHAHPALAQAANDAEACGPCELGVDALG
ncbi:MAG TPA: hypothetical protein VGQ83_00975 [Polyangia bacterium]|jgi:hypothetical protein